MIETALMVLAQIGPDNAGGVVENAAENGANAPSSSPFGIAFWVPMLLALAVMMLLMRPRKADTRLKQQLAELKKNDRVVTAGGIIGTVAAIRDDNNSVTIRIDESSNAKMQVLKTSIVQVLGDDKASGQDS